MNKKTEDKLAQIFGILVSIIICGFIIFFIGMCTKGIHEQNMNTSYEFEVIEKYDKIAPRFLSGGETEYHVIYKRRSLYKNEVDEGWKTFDEAIPYHIYRNVKENQHFKGDLRLFRQYEF